MEQELEELEKNHDFRVDQVHNLQQRIDKAIEYINKTQMGEGYKKMLLELLGSDKE